MALDVHPAMRKAVRDPSRPLFVTEGIKKGDALTSQDLATVSLVGVWNWRGTNEHGGKTALSGWEYVALEGRKVYIVFDSDVMEKREVYAALSRLKTFLQGRKATVLLIYLPAGSGESKQGVDDYLVAGHEVDELLSHATSELKSPPHDEEPEHPYRATPGGLIWDKPTQNGSVPTPLTNFAAKITADVSEDDGAEVERVFEIEATWAGRRHGFTVPAGKFAGMNWPVEHLGASAIVYPGFGAKDHARAAVQLLSGDVPAREIYSHTGWREIGGEWLYLHAGGATGGGEGAEARVALSGTLRERELPMVPSEGEESREAVRASLALLKVAEDALSYTVLAATYRAPLGESDFSVHLSGPTGEGKSEFAALFQQHYGVKLDARRLLSWESTENAIEGQAFALKDQLLILDDFAPTGTSYDIERWHKKADRVLRAKGNHSGRQRMRPDTTLRPEKPPRALIISTGEDVPRGQSLRARMMVLELSPGALDWERLTGCQNAAASGLYARAMSDYIRWLAARYEDLRESLKEEHAELRKAAGASGQHRRTPGIVADLALGLRYFLLFAHEFGAVDTETARELWAGGWRALGEAASGQSQHQVASEPTRRFRELLSAAIASGRAHVANPEGGAPAVPEAWGWRQATVGTGNFEREEQRPQGERIGWLEDENLYLEPNAALASVQKQGRDSGDSLAVTGRTLRKRLRERGLLLSTDEARQVLTVRKTLEGKRREVLHISVDFFSLHTEKPDQPDHGNQKAHEQAESTPPLWSGFLFATRPAPEQEPDHGEHGRVINAPWSGQRTEPDHQPDQQEPPIHAENSGNGRVGRVFDAKKEQNGGEGVRSQSGPAPEEPPEDAAWKWTA
ncbi:MAG: DUF3854 domain-containing protein [Rubrobacter sp.]|nr:DUF3854 domain-containing protein [Rubrobacter sp.]